MNHKQIEEYILSKPGSWLDYPFGAEVAVYKVSPSKRTLDLQVGTAQGANEESKESVHKGTETADRSLQRSDVPASTSSVGGSAGKQAGAVQVEGKMYALITEGKDPVQISLKCDPQLALELRKKYASVMPGYHLNKKHWNTIVVTKDWSEQELFELIDHSYNLVTGVTQSAA